MTTTYRPTACRTGMAMEQVAMMLAVALLIDVIHAMGNRRSAFGGIGRPQHRAAFVATHPSRERRIGSIAPHRMERHNRPTTTSNTARIRITFFPGQVRDGWKIGSVKELRSRLNR